MNKQLSATVKGMFITGLALLMMLPVMAQREKAGGIITQEQVRQITELVKPLRDQLEKQLTGNPTYNAYVEDLKRIHASNSIKEKRNLTEQVLQKYSGFFKEVWSAAKVDEQAYQSKIRRVFPTDIGNLLQFDVFLNFSLITPNNIRNALSETPALDKCLDICSMATGEINSGSTLISGAGGTYGNCFLRTNSWAMSATSFSGAAAEVNGYLRNNITIPGTLPNDARKLRVRKSYDLKQEATALAVLGGGYAESALITFQSVERLVVYAPIIWGAHIIKNKTVNENYVLLKKNVSLSSVSSYSKTVSLAGSGNWSFTDCNNIKWSICEEK